MRSEDFNDGYGEGYNGCGFFDMEEVNDDFDKGYNNGFDEGYNAGFDLRKEHELEND